MAVFAFRPPIIWPLMHPKHESLKSFYTRWQIDLFRSSWVINTDGLPLSSAFTGCVSQNASYSNWLFWPTDPSTALQPATYSRVSPASPTWLWDDGCGLLIWPAWCTSRPSLYSRQAGVSGLWRQHLERSAVTRDISAQSLEVFRQRLKTFLFTRSYPNIFIWLTFWRSPWTLQ